MKLKKALKFKSFRAFLMPKHLSWTWTGIIWKSRTITIWCYTGV